MKTQLDGCGERSGQALKFEVFEGFSGGDDIGFLVSFRVNLMQQRLILDKFPDLENALCDGSESMQYTAFSNKCYRYF